MPSWCGEGAVTSLIFPPLTSRIGKKHNIVRTLRAKKQALALIAWVCMAMQTGVPRVAPTARPEQGLALESECSGGAVDAARVAAGVLWAAALLSALRERRASMARHAPGSLIWRNRVLPGYTEPYRVECQLISDREMRRLLRFVKAHCSDLFWERHEGLRNACRPSGESRPAQTRGAWKQ